MFGWFTGMFAKNDKRVIRQSQNNAGGRVVRGDMCGGNLRIKGRPDITPGTFIGGNLIIDATASSVQDIAVMDFEVQGRVIRNGQDVTEEFYQLRKNQ